MEMCGLLRKTMIIANALMGGVTTMMMTIAAWRVGSVVILKAYFMPRV